MLEEVRWLRRLGHDVTALTFDLAPDGSFVEDIDADGIEVLDRRGLGGRVTALRRALRGRFDVLVGHTSTELVWLVTRGLGLPYIVYHNDPPLIAYGGNVYALTRRYRRVLAGVRGSVAGYADHEPSPLGRRRAVAEVWTLLKHLALRRAHAVIVPSDRTRRELHLLHGVEATVVRGCLTEDVVRSTSRPEPAEIAAPGVPVVLSVCRLEPVKRVDLLIRAFPRVLQAVPDAVLVVVGRGSQLEPLKALAASLGVDGAVSFAGYVPDVELPRYHAAADVFAAPAMADYAIAPYEALARGCRVVWTTEMEMLPDVMASGALFVAPPEEEAFASAVVDALRAPRPSPVNLNSMTWESRNRRISELCRLAAASRCELPPARLTFGRREGS